MYVANFDGDGFELAVGAASYVPPPDGMLPKEWIPTLSGGNPVDFSLRLRWEEGSSPSGVIIVPGQRGRQEFAPGDTLASIGTAAAPGSDFRPADDAGEFDLLTQCGPEAQVCTAFEGFSARGEVTVPIYRAWPDVLASLNDEVLGDSNLVYQANLMVYRPDKEMVRTVRKYAARLDQTSDLPGPVRELQRVISSRLLEPGYLIEEIVASGDAEVIGRLERRVSRSFDDAMGSLGFGEAPTVRGRFDELLATGLHPFLLAPPEHFLHLAARHVSTTQLIRSLRSPIDTLRSSEGQPTGGKPGVFISYSSGDFASAQMVVDHLESEGLGCWIAPRNIRPGEAYPEAIMRGIENASCVVVLFSRGSNLSPHVLREIERALHRNLVIIPIRMEETLPTGAMEYLLSTCQRLDAFEGEASFAAALEELTERVRGIVKVGH